MAFERIRAMFSRRAEPDSELVPAPDIRERRSAFSTDRQLVPLNLGAESRQIELQPPSFSSEIKILDDAAAGGGATFDAAEFAVETYDAALKSFGMDSTTLKQAFTLGQGAIPDDLFNWYTQQGFIGYQACALVSQHWLVNKALMIPAKDAVRNGYKIGTVSGEEIELDTLAKIQAIDKKFKLPAQMIEFAQNTRRFGIRIAIFNVESDDEDYYRKPFNIDGVTPGSYKGISQVDPNWIAPILDAQAVANPASMDFYEPTYWLIAGQLYHKSHVVVARYADPPDILKPTYQYGGLPLTQLILERVYAAERTANEAPMLAETKRLQIVFTDVAAVTANPGGFEQRLRELISFRNNYGVYVADTEDKLEQIETSLADLDDVIMSQYQLVSAVSEIPATKLMGTSPKGFNATGEFEEDSYYDLLENIQTDLTMLVERHHELAIRSLELGDDLEVVAVWNPVSSPSTRELAEINLLKAQQMNALQLSGAIDAGDIRDALIIDPDSGFTGIAPFEDMDELDDEDLDFGKMDGAGAPVRGAKDPTTVVGPNDEPDDETKALMAGAEDGELEYGTGEREAPSRIEGDVEALGELTLADPQLGARKEGINPDTKPAAKGNKKANKIDESGGSADTSADITEDSNVLGYVRITPSLEEGARLHIWATRAGIVNATRPDEFHVTLAHSPIGIEGFEPDPSADYAIVPTGEIGLLGPADKPALVLFVDSLALRKRNAELEKMGAVSIYEEYRPHVTIKYNPAPGDLEKARAAYKTNPVGKIVMGDEIRSLI